MKLDLSRPRQELAAQIVASTSGHPYYAFHSPRYATLLSLIARHLDRREGRILDIGPTEFTDVLREQFALPVDSLGFQPDGATGRGRHFRFDLNDTQWREKWRTDLPAYDLVVLAEVIEHVHTAPSLVLSFLRTLVRPGGILIVQTPNAVRFGARIKLLLGRQPYQLISEDVTSPAHFREYTDGEIRAYASGAGFDVVETIFCSYFDIRFARHDPSEARPHSVLKLVNSVYRHLPPRWRTGMTSVLARTGD